MDFLDPVLGGTVQPVSHRFVHHLSMLRLELDLADGGWDNSFMDLPVGNDLCRNGCHGRGRR